MNCRYCVPSLALLAVGLLSGASGEEKGATAPSKFPFAFKDVGADAGIFPHAAGLRGHGAAWGDLDGDGWPDLFVATFHNAGSKPGFLLRNDKGKFRPDNQEHLHTTGIGSGALFVDLTNSGRLDLYVSNCAYGRGDVGQLPGYLFRNDGGGIFTDVSKDSGACPPGYEGRGLSALDADGDGLLDLVICEQYYSSKVKTGPVLYHNKGKHQFENAAKAAGLPAGYGGLGVAVGDVNGDGWPDVFMTGGLGDNRLYLNDGKGTFREAPGAGEVFRWAGATANDPPAGVCIADVNRDGLPDVVVGSHTKAPWAKPIAIRLYLNRGVKGGVPKFEDVTDAAGLKPLNMKSPHVEIQDFDNDGWPDIYVSIVKFADGKPYPMIYRGLGNKDGAPRFSDVAWTANDFPTAADLAGGKRTDLFDKKSRETKMVYTAAAPSCDFDRDGKLDLFLANWWAESPSLLLKNETPSGNWLDVLVEGRNGVNRMGIGSRVNIYTSGKLGQPGALIGSREVAIGYGYCSGQEAVAHFGLAKELTVDVEVILPHGKGTLTRKAVAANQRLTVKP